MINNITLEMSLLPQKRDLFTNIFLKAHYSISFLTVLFPTRQTGKDK